MNFFLSSYFRKFLVPCVGGLLLLAASSASAQTAAPGYLFTHLAGPLGGPDQVDGTGTAARFNTPTGIVADHAGNLYVSDQKNYAIRTITPAGAVSTLPLVDESGNSLRLFSLSGVALDSSGTLYVADERADTIRKITPAGRVTTLAGAAYSHFYSGTTVLGDSRDGTGTDARFFYPAGLAVDAAGNVFVADTFNHTIRKITPGGVVTTIAGTAGQAGETDGNGPAARFWNPRGIVLDKTGNLYVTDRAAIRKIAPSGDVTTLAGSATGQQGNTDGVGADARFFAVSGAALDSQGNLYVTDSRNETVRKITPGGAVTTLTGVAGQRGSADGTGTTARFRNPVGLTIDSADNLFVADSENHSIRKITPAGVVTTFASTASGADYIDGPGAASRFSGPQGVAVDGAGNVFVADHGNHVLRKITPSGTVTTLAHLSISSWANSVALDKSGNVYVTNDATIKKVTPDGVESELWSDYIEGSALAVDNAGNLYFADGSAINKMTPAGVVTPFVGMNITGVSALDVDGTGANARFSSPSGLVFDAAGNLYVLDSGNSKLRKVTPDGVVTTVVVTDKIYAPGTVGALAMDRAGNFYVTDPWLCTVLKITPAGSVTVIGGSGITGCVDGVGSAAHFNYPGGIAVDGAGNLYLADSYNCAIRKGTLTGPPVITVQPLSQSVAPGTNVQFSVTASASPAPTYQWYFNGGVFSGAKTDTLSLANTRSTDVGDYTVVVSNELGSVTSAKATLAVSSAPAPSTSTPSTPASSTASGGGGSFEGWFGSLLFAIGIARGRVRRTGVS